MQTPIETVCPLTKQVMRNPVMIENGKNFEYDALMKIFGRGKYVDPTTNKPLRSNKAIPNIALASLISKQKIIGVMNPQKIDQLQKQHKIKEQDELNKYKNQIVALKEEIIGLKDQVIQKQDEIVGMMEKQDKLLNQMQSYINKNKQNERLNQQLDKYEKQVIEYKQRITQLNLSANKLIHSKDCELQRVQEQQCYLHNHIYQLNQEIKELEQINRNYENMTPEHHRVSKLPARHPRYKYHEMEQSFLRSFYDSNEFKNIRIKRQLKPTINRCIICEADSGKNTIQAKKQSKNMQLLKSETQKIKKQGKTKRTEFKAETQKQDAKLKNKVNKLRKMIKQVEQERLLLSRNEKTRTHSNSKQASQTKFRIHKKSSELLKQRQQQSKNPTTNFGSTNAQKMGNQEKNKKRRERAMMTSSIQIKT